MLKQLLQLEGHEVFEASDGPGGLALLLGQRLDVALIDIGLPGLSGYEVARQVRQRGHLQSVLLVALTGYGTPRDVEAAREAGFDSHLIKPLRYPDLCQLLREHQGGLPADLQPLDNCPRADGM
jgi:CheY-like chemotaxis protein